MSITRQISRFLVDIVKYISTRGEAPILGFKDALLTGLARDGGLYVPEVWPKLQNEEIRQFQGQPFQQIAKEVLTPFVQGEIDQASFEKMVDASYATFNHPSVAPLVQIDHNHWILELFHGPTLAFKDVAMQLLGRLMDHVLAERGKRATIVGATSGDTGSAAIEAFGGLENCDIFILFPEGKVSPVQQRQMTTIAKPNVFPLAIKGNFDDCQAIVKAMFNDHKFRDDVQLSGVNSINWARIMAQIVYYFSSAANLGAPDRTVSFSVPTGNFGDIFAGYAAARMGLPIDKLLIATNQNDILTRTFETGRYEVAGVFATQSPSMDIQVSSNFERLLFECHDRDAATVRTLMAGLSQSGAFTLENKVLASMKTMFAAGRSDENETTAQIAKTHRDCGYLLDPHTAVGVKVAGSSQLNGNESNSAMITLATAHPAKFPDAVERASGIRPGLPSHLSDLMEREEDFTVLENSAEIVQQFIRENQTSA